MQGHVSRKFALLDGMILVAVPAVWLTAIRHLTSRRMGTHFWYLDHHRLLPLLHDEIGLFLIILSFALILIRFRPPRPGRRRLWRQPGLAACVAALAGMAIKAISTITSYCATVFKFGTLEVEVFWGPWPYCGPAVAGAWLALYLSGHWRAERGLIDRLGRLLGVCWLLEFVLGEIEGIRWAVILGNLISRAWS
ncbi:hypothetical protein SAMN05444166_5643 [Singulisphaera sp. GP187]|uniref:hypothetical protein n=1 Tax=Singulisphaera sp. GP187 TaxID=1882752 RepID=UPI0009292274|nr:hypothetical protein [Singulisphaera sp. GP187]SIO58341.1 hypothetical protein SAMN05444166_5643 [Singulisphaera sp. GP187]